MAKFKDRHGRENVLAPTAEEVITFLAAGELNSYKQLPVNLYQISFKFRDEFRPRFGVLRSREFLMKDAYSFHADATSLDVTYKKMYEAYKRIFTRCGLDFVIVEAESGEMGGSGSHQFTIPCESGEDIIVYTEDGSYAANIERAAVDPVTKNKNVGTIGKMEDVHTPNVGTIEALCEFLKVKPEETIKTLIFGDTENTVVAVVRGDHELNPEKLTQALGGKHVELADEATIVRLTGAVMGFAGPMGMAQKADMVFIDHAVAAMGCGVAGANKSHYHTMHVVPGRDFPLEGTNVKVADIRNAVEGDAHDGKKLLFKHGIEVGQVFKLGTKYSVKLGERFKDEAQQEKPCIMGCYGIGINRIMASAIEMRFDKDGINWPISIAPFEVIVTPVNQEDEQIGGAAEAIYKELSAAGLEVLLDDRDVRGGVKFKDADLLGIPVRITIGKKSIAEGNVEIKLRNEAENRKVPFARAAKEVIEIVNSLKAKLNVAN